MTLEDVSTLSELMNGFVAPAKVEDAVSVVQKECSCVVKNFAEIARQLSAVASVLAATENKDSLDQFIKLDGRKFLNSWVQEALNCSDSPSDCSVEESIIALLGELDKLPIVQECSISSIIMTSVKDLFGHKSFRVQDKARALFDNWNRGRETDIDDSNVEKNWILHDNDASASGKVVEGSGSPEQSSDETSLLRENGNGDVPVLESAGGEYPQSGIVDASKPESIQDGKISTADNRDASCKTSNWADNDNGLENSQESLSIENESSIPSAEQNASLEVLSVSVAWEANPAPLTSVSVKEPEIPDHDGADKSDSSQKRFSASDMDVVASKDLSHDGDILRKAENHKSSSCRMEGTGLVGNASGVIMKSVFTADVSEPMVDAKDSIKINRSEGKVHYGIGNAREVSGQVSNGWEQKGKTLTFSNHHVSGEPLYGVKTKEILSGRAFPQKGEEQLYSKDCIQDTFPSLATESAKVASNSGNGFSDIDLNEEVYHEGMDFLITSVSSIAASGTPDGYGTVSVKGNSYISKQRQDLLDIDLNMTGGGLDGAADTVLTDQIPASSCLLSGESSIEVNSRIAGRHKSHNLDLNSVGDNDDSPSSDGMDYLGDSTTAASSSSREPLSTNIDLNENLCLVNDTYDQQTHLRNLSSCNMNSCGELKRDNGVICIMGRRVETNGKNLAPSQSIMPNGQSEISFMGNSLPKQLGFEGLQHAVASIPQLYGRTVFPTGLSTSLSAVCEQGYIPYMVDSRGVQVAPQIIGSPMAFPHTYSLLPFPMSVNTTPFNMNGVGPAKASFDLNSSSMMVEGWTGEFGGWTSGQNHLEESMRSTSQCSSSGLRMKRKEPDCGLELTLYPYNYKQQQLWR